MVIALMQMICYVRRKKTRTFYIYYHNYWGRRTNVQLQLQILIKMAF